MASILETPIKEPAQAHMATDCKNCGNTFKEDSIYCRKCGAKRPSDTLTPPSSGRFSWLLDKMGLHGDSAKRARHYESDLQRRLATVADAVSDDAEEAEADVLKSMCMALACPRPDRNSFENESVGILGQVLTAKKSHWEKIAKDKEALLSQGQSQARVAESDHKQAMDAVRIAKDSQANIKKAAEGVQSRVQAKSSELRQAQETFAAAEAALKEAQHEKEQVDDLYNSHFLPLKNGTAGSKHAEDKLLKGLLPHLQTWGCEDCLLAGFAPAVHHQPSGRGDWCSRVVTAVEQLFAKPRQDADKKVADAQSKKAMAEQALQKLKAECDGLDRELIAAHAKEAGAAKDVAEKQKAQSKAEDDERHARARLPALQDELEQAKNDVQAFSEGPLADFQWLTGHTETEGLQLLDDAAKVEALLNTTPSHLPGSLDGAGSARAKKVIGKLNDPTFTDPDVPNRTLRMLSDFAGGAVGPSPNERTPAQKAAAEMIKKALKSRQTQLLGQIERQGGFHFDAEKLQQLQGPDGAKLRAQESNLVSKAVADADTNEKAVCGQPVRAAETAEKEAQLKYDELAKKANQSENIFKQHFLPLKDGTSSGRDKDLEICLSLLKDTKCEDCLMAGFSPAAGHKPSDRGTWCTKVMVEVEKLLQKSVSDNQLELQKASKDLAAKKAATKQAKALCAEAKEHSHKAQSAYDELMALFRYIADLENLRAEMAQLLEGC